MAVSTIIKPLKSSNTIGNSMIASAATNLHNCNGQVVDTPKFETRERGIIQIGGRLVISDFVRSGGNPGAVMTLPNGLKVKNTFRTAAVGYSANADGVRLGEYTYMSGQAGDQTILINATESYANQVSSSRVFFMVCPVLIEVY